MITMAKFRKLEILKVPVEIEYTRPILGRLYWLFLKLKLTRVLRVKVDFMGEPVSNAIWLCIPSASKGGGDGELL